VKNKNKRAMLGNLIGGFIVILIGFSMLPMISQEIDNMMNCNQTDVNVTGNFTVYQQPIGETNSFGGGGGQFGGYTGTVTKSWTSNLAIYKTNETFTGACLNNDLNNAAGRALLKIVPAFFVLAIVLEVVGIIYNSLRYTGLTSYNRIFKY